MLCPPSNLHFAHKARGFRSRTLAIRYPEDAIVRFLGCGGYGLIG